MTSAPVTPSPPPGDPPGAPGDRWPDRGWDGRHRGWAGHRRGGPPRRAFGCLFALFFVVMGSAFVVVASFVLSVVGLLGGGSAPGLVQVAAFVVLAIAVVAFAAMARLLRGTARTLDDLVSAAARVEAGDYAARVAAPRGGPRPLRDLVQGFNTMAERLAADERQRRSLLADVSHELRTPLTVVQGSLEAMADGVHPADDAHLEAILDETRVMSRLVDDLRTVALSETGSLALHPEPTDLGILAGEVVASFAAAAARGGVSLTADVDEAIPPLDVDPVRIREVLANLVANSLRATPPGGAVTLVARGSGPGEEVVLTVSDTGAGMTAEELAHAFDRFWKSPESRGSGLGLAIARNLVAAHGGTLVAESRPGQGTTMRVTLPQG